MALVLVCDYYWSHPSDLWYIVVGGRCGVGMYCGSSCSAVDFTPAHVYWSIGACHCDYCESNQSGVRYTLAGGRCTYRIYCGISYLDVSDMDWVASWSIGARFFVIATCLFHPVSAMLLLVVGVITEGTVVQPS